jgi:hypothetical protein
MAKLKPSQDLLDEMDRVMSIAENADKEIEEAPKADGDDAPIEEVHASSFRQKVKATLNKKAEDNFVTIGHWQEGDYFNYLIIDHYDKKSWTPHQKQATPLSYEDAVKIIDSLGDGYHKTQLEIFDGFTMNAVEGLLQVMKNIQALLVV